MTPSRMWHSLSHESESRIRHKMTNKLLLYKGNRILVTCSLQNLQPRALSFPYPAIANNFMESLEEHTLPLINRTLSNNSLQSRTESKFGEVEHSNDRPSKFVLPNSCLTALGLLVLMLLVSQSISVVYILRIEQKACEKSLGMHGPNSPRYYKAYQMKVAQFP